MPVLPFDVNSTLGAVFLGNIGAGVLYGITSLQTFTYFKNSQRDGRPFRLLIAFLWILDSVHMAFMTHGVYTYLVIDFSNPLDLVKPTWSLLCQIFITCISDLLVRLVFARRVWLLSSHNHILVLVIIATSVFVFAAGFAFACRAFIVVSYTMMIKDESWLLYTGLGASVIADGLIAASLCTVLQRTRTGFKSTDSIVYILMLYSINTGLLTSVCAAATFVTFAIWPHGFIYMGIYFTLSKLYVNSLLAVLNSRASLRERGTGVSTIPVSPSSIESMSMGFVLGPEREVPELLPKPRPIRFSLQYK